MCPCVIHSVMTSCLNDDLQDIQDHHAGLGGEETFQVSVGLRINDPLSSTNQHLAVEGGGGDGLGVGAGEG